MCVCVCVCVVRVFFRIILYVNCFGRTVLYMCIEYHIHVSAQGVDERMINVYYYYCALAVSPTGAVPLDSAVLLSLLN